MHSGLYVAVSAQRALERRLETIANNVANAGTAGYRAEAVSFESLISPNAGPDPVAYSSTGRSYLSRAAGELVATGGTLDVAVEGDAWLSVQSPNGVVYTRDGRMRMSETGELQTLGGRPVLDAGGAAILLDPNGGPAQISRDGMISQNGRQIGAIGLFQIPEQANLARIDGSSVIPDQQAQPIVDFTRAGVVQGHIERANVNPVMEMTKLIAVQRTFEAITATLNESETTMQDAIRTLGSGG